MKVTIDKLNKIYQPFGIEYKAYPKDNLLVAYKGNAINHEKIFKEHFYLKVSTKQKLFIGVLHGYAEKKSNSNNIYPMVDGNVYIYDGFSRIDELSDMYGWYDGSSHLIIEGDTIYTKKVGSWIGERGANIKMISKMLKRKIKVEKQ